MSNTDTLIPNSWDENATANMSEQDLLLYRSNLLGSDKRVTNYGGGNTSAKIMCKDPISEQDVDVLWVKGSGGDIGSMKMDGFATLYMEKLQSLKTLYRGKEWEDEMVHLLPHCTFNLNTRAGSIDTPLHAYIPKRHIDHLHPDSIIAIAASQNSKALTQDIFGGDIGWLPWQRPGYQLGLDLSKIYHENPNLKGVILESHGLFTWADTARECYTLSIDMINKAQQWLDKEMAGGITGKTIFGGVKHQSLDSDERRAIAARLMPVIRGHISKDIYQVGHFNHDADVLEFVNSVDLERLSAMGTSCPDHFLRTKIKPLILPFNPEDNNLEDVLEGLEDLLATYRTDYQNYYEKCKHDDSPPMRDSNAIIYLIPGVGMLSFAKDKATARIASEFYINAIHVMRGADTLSDYQGLPPQEAFDIEYWLLEEAKLQRMPKPKSLAGQVAFITGGAGGIGQATAHRLLQEGACVVLADIDADNLSTVQDKLSQDYSPDVVHTVHMDVTQEKSVMQGFQSASLAFGGVDILVSNAGIASSAPIDETSLSMWQLNQDILSTGYFLVSREGFKTMKMQNLGGRMIFIASKNALVASPNAAAYCTAKASEIQLARCLALEGASHNIRVNTINPDAVIQGSKIWDGDWKQERADSYNITIDELATHYRNRSMLKQSVLPSDIAQGVYFFASEASAKSTGNILNVDAGHAGAFTR